MISSALLQDVRLRPKLKKLCSQEIAVYCADVKPGALLACAVHRMQH